MINAVNDWGDAFMTSVAGALAMMMAALPKVIGFVLILLIGWFIAGLIAKAVASVLRTIRFNEMAQRSGFTGFIRNMGVQTDASSALAGVAKWFIRLMVLVIAFDALGLPAVSEVLRELLLWIPNLIVALVILMVAGLAANALSRLVRGATAQAGFSNPDLLANISRIAIWAFAVVIAVNQVGIATTLVNTLFMSLTGAVALALGLAFGLGGRETAAEIVRKWYGQGKEAAPKVERAAEIGARQAQAGGPSPAAGLGAKHE